MAEIRIAIVGAGLSGMTCAYELQKNGFDFTVFERGETVGGRARSEVFYGHRVNLGATFMTPAIDITHVAYFRELGLEGELSDVPSFTGDNFQMLVGKQAMTLSQLDKVFSASDVARFQELGAYLTTLKFDNFALSPDLARAHQVSIADYLGEWGFSQEFVSNFLTPFVVMFTGVRPRELSAAKGLHILICNFVDNISPRGGMDTLCRAIARRLGDRVMLGAEVGSIARRDRKFVLHYDRDDVHHEFEADVLVLAASTQAINRLVPELDLEPSSGELYAIIVKGKPKPEYRQAMSSPAGIRYQKDSDVYYTLAYRLPYDLSQRYDEYQVLKQVHWKPVCHTPKPSEVPPALVTKIEGLYICGDFLTFAGTESAIVSGKKVAELIGAKYRHS